MLKINYALTGLAAVLFAGCQPHAGKLQSEYPAPPHPEKINQELTIHGQTRIDPYYWLNQRDNPRVIEYLEAENKYLETVMEDTKDTRDSLFNELVGRIKQQDETVPYLDNGWLYYTRFEQGREYPVYCRKKDSAGAAEEVLLNVNELAMGHSYCSVSGIWISPDTHIMAFGLDTVSRRKYEIRFKDLSTGLMLPDRIPETTGSVAWANDNKTCFYTRKNPVTLRSEKIFKHTIPENPTLDPLVYEEKDETFSTEVSRCKTGQFIVIDCTSTLSSESRILNSETPSGQFLVVNPREPNHEYGIEPAGDQIYIRTNLNASNFRLMKAPAASPGKDHWTEVIAHRESVFLEGFEAFRNFLAVEERSNGLTQLRVFNLTDGSDHYVDFGEETYSAGFSTNREFDSKLLRYSYSSMTTPVSTFDYDMESHDRKLLKEQEVLGGFNKENYESKRLFAPGRDGVKVPMSIVYRKGIKLDGNNPLLLYGYGSYGISMSASFNSDRLSLLDRGFVYAIAHIRGGQEMGRQWYEDGKLLKKINTFTDFIDAGEYLVSQGYTTPELLCAQGGSAGGLLMGAVVNMRPDLFRAVVAQVPFVDVVTTMLDSSIPLTTSEYDEWGNPNIREYYEYMLSYSPYDQVKPLAYPALLVTTGLHDSQVQYFEPAKWVAKLRDLKTDDHLILFRINMEAGHGGASGRFQRYRETALVYTFLLDQTAVKL
jgi:oligopeptidase B